MAYSYVHTTGDIITRGPDKQLLRPYVDKYLYSIINGFTQKQFGYDTLDKTAMGIKQFYNGLYYNEKLFIDSGGYSIIAGDVSPRDTRKFIQVYNYFLEKYNDSFDYLMSLDVPIFLQYPKKNTTTEIYNYNRMSLIESKQVLDQNPELYDKFVFVWHFKLKKQFDIWRAIYDDIFGSENPLKNFAIGGLVSLRGITGIKFSPFIAPAYRCLKLIYDKNLDFNSVLHILGVYGKHDRFIMMFMDKLFNNVYLKERNPDITITFDTVNYTLSGLYKIRQNPLFQLPLIDFKTNTIYENKGLNDYIDAYIPESLHTYVRSELENICYDRNINNPPLMSLTYVIYSQLLDWIMNHVIETEGLMDIFLESKNYNNLKNTLSPILDKVAIQYPDPFGNMKQLILNNFLWLHSLHLAWLDGADMNRIDSGIDTFIKHIGFPYDLYGTFNYK